MRVLLTNLGCKLNQAELDDVARRARADGHEIVGSLEDADLHVVNTCTVTQAAARTSRKVGRWANRRNTRARTVLTGCYVNGSPDEAARLAGVDLVVPNEHKSDLFEHVYERFPAWRPAAGAGIPVPYVPLEFGLSRALVKIEDGCNMSCTFCVIPLTRGRQRSLPSETIVAEVARLAEGGFREVVLTGVQISSYRWGEERLSRLVSRLLDETAIERLRLTSIAPWDFDPALLDLVETGRVCRHFHLSLQSGCDATLRRMRRPYDQRAFASLVRRIRRRVPGIAITTDLIVGFPGESEAEFVQSVEFVERMSFAKVHAFPYSARAGTAAAEMEHVVAPAILRERMARMLEVAARGEDAFRTSHVGQTVPVLWEQTRQGVWRGTSDNYLKVSTTHPSDLRLALTPTLIERMELDALYGRPLLAA